ncbi:phage tail spike protein [Streptococcus mitis]|uniref:phage tail spike protein n=1 Tax=Streptococcus mitis TaxID=28037 RepID=UPI0018857167|nr:phage tail spike protein [Streptococcus mitis]
MIYLFNQTEELIDVIDEASLVDFTHTIELNQFDRASFEIPIDYKPNIIKEAQFFGFQSRDRAFCLFRISEKSYDIGLTIQGIDRAESDLHSFIIEDKRPGGNASDVLREILKGTGYQLGNVDGLTINGNMSFYYISVRQALVKLIESYACEFRVKYTFVENKIIGRYIDLNQRFGRKTGHQFEYGSNILNITYEESSDEVVTALIGRGKGEQSTDETGEATGGYGRRIQFKDVVWSVAKGDPVDKPAGQNYVANETARNIYGLHQNGVIKHRFGVYTNEDIEDPVELLKATYKELKRLSIPIVTFKANLLDLANAIEQDIWIGDSVGIVRDQIGIAFETRIHKLIIDKLDDNRSVVELGDYQTLQAKDRSTRQQAIKDAVSGFSEGLIEEAIANEVDRRNKEFDEKIRVNKLEFDNELQRAKERAEEVKRQISSEIDKKFQSFDNAAINEAKRRAEEALRNAGASTLLAQEAKRISERAREDITNLQASSQNALSQIESFKNQYGTKLNEVKNTADGLFTKMGAVETYISKDGQRQEELKRYARTESASQASAIREQISRDYVGKSTYQEDVRGLERRFSEVSTQTNNDIATKIAQYKQTVDGQFASITSQIAGKANQTDFQRVRETSQLYERIIGSNENDISNKVARMALTNQLFQVEVAKSLGSDNNLIVRSKSMDRHTLVNEGNTKRVFVNNGIFTIRCTGNPNYTFAGFTLPLYIDKLARGETYTLNFKYRIMGRLDHNFTVVAKNHQANEGILSSNIATSSTAVSSSWQEFNETYTISKDFEFGDNRLYPLYIYLAKNGWVEIKEIMLVRASQTNGYKASQFDDMSEAVRTVQSQLAGSWAVQNINSAGDIISGINLGADGRNRFIGKTFHITGETLIDNAVIKSAMVDKLKTANFEAGSVTTTILDAEAVTADKLRVDQALFNKLVANEAYLSMLFAKQAFINRVRSISIDASQIKTGTLSGDRIYGGTISGTTLTGHTRINLGEYGSFDTVNGGLQINVPRAVNSKDGLGVQFIGSSGRGENVPYGLFVYKDDDITRGDTARDTDEFIMTVQGYINTKGIGWLKTGKGKVGSVTTGTLGFWQSTVALDYAPNDIYYTYNGTAYGLWAIIKQSFSDSRLKENIVDCKHKALDYIQQFQFKEYDWKKQEDRPQQAHTKIGLIAQEVQAVDPTLVYENGDTLNLDNLRLTTMALKAIQELNQRLEKLEEIA